MSSFPSKRLSRRWCCTLNIGLEPHREPAVRRLDDGPEDAVEVDEAAAAAAELDTRSEVDRL